MALKGDTFTFTISERGETTGNKFDWAFTAKKRLTIRDNIQKDSIRRSLVGERAQDAAQETLFRAEILAHLSVSISDAPKEWKEAAGGLDLYDDNIIVKVYEQVVEGQIAAQKEMQKESEENKEKLRKLARNKKDEAKDEGTSGGA